MSTLEASPVENSSSPNNVVKVLKFYFRYKGMNISVFVRNTILDG
jgi:hypothetical protein